MIANEYYDEIPLGVESAWPAVLAAPLLAVVPPSPFDVDNLAQRTAALMMTGNGPTAAMGSL